METYFRFNFFAIIYYNKNAFIFLFVPNTRKKCDYLVLSSQRNYDYSKRL